MKKPFTYICTLMRDQNRVENVYKNIIPFLEEERHAIWPAIDCNADTLDMFLQRNDISFVLGPKITNDPYAYPRPILGLIASLILILEDAQKNNYESIVFFEDDVQLNPDFYGKLEKVLTQLPADADFLRLYYKAAPNSMTVQDLFERSENLITIFPTDNRDESGSDTIYIPKTAYNKLIQDLKKADYPLDWMFSENGRTRRWKGYAVIPNDFCHHGHYGAPSGISRGSNLPNRCKDDITM